MVEVTLSPEEDTGLRDNSTHRFDIVIVSSSSAKAAQPMAADRTGRNPKWLQTQGLHQFWLSALHVVR